jgi:transcriptional regulator with XRE-family HTH domain
MDEGDFLQRLGGRILSLRETAGLTQSEMARRAGLVRSFYARVEGGRHNASVGTLVKIAQAHGLTVSALLDGLEREVG